MDNVNKQLTDLYLSYWDSLIKQSHAFENQKLKPASPLLLQVDQAKFDSADLKIMYCGQETKGWGALNVNTMQERLKRYDDYFLQGGYKKTSGKSIFWKTVTKLQEHFNQEFKDKNIVSIWNNISKIGLHQKKGMTDDVRQLERNYFPVFTKELEILKPDIVVFMTGPNRDKDLKFYFPDVEIEQASEIHNKRQLASLNSKSLPKIALRTYHPNYFGGFNETMDEIKLKLKNSQ